jgi:hypothetical protein
MSRALPPTGANPPEQIRTASGAVVELVPLATEICHRYALQFTDEREHYGSAGEAWCLHDNQYLLAWAVQDARDGTVDLVEQTLWLRDVLDRRGFPVDRLARNLEMAAEVVSQRLADAPLAQAVSELFSAAAAAVHAGHAATARARTRDSDA